MAICGGCIVRGGVTWSLALAIVQVRRRQALAAFYT
jgi:hypothetical protein